MSFAPCSGVIAGYDPGGNGCHGLAVAEFQAGACTGFAVETLANAEAVITRLESADGLAAVGIDTLASWATGPSGWRPADLWLRERYKPIQASIVSPNGLYGSMALSGMGVIHALRQSSPSIPVVETHPKVLYWACAGRKYDYAGSGSQMDADLSEWLGADVSTRNDHEWDAALSVLAALRGVQREWQHDLFTESRPYTGRLLFPAGPVHYWWPE